MDAKKTGAFIALLRKEKNLKQAELAEELHVSDKAISRWETGKGFPDINTIEDLAAVLDVSIAELFKGERIPQQMTKEESDQIALDWMSFVNEMMHHKKVQNTILGFLAGLVLSVVVFMHLTSPIYINTSSDALKIETLSDGTVVAVLNEKAAGYELSETINPDNEQKETFISCYETGWSKLTKQKNDSVIILGDQDSLNRVYYYPSENADELIYSNTTTEESGGVITLPRLIYNMWIFAGVILSLAGIIACRLAKKKDILIRITMVPVIFTISTVLILFGKFDQVYNAAYYFYGIVLLSIILYILVSYVYSKRRK
ncbi:MAG: helix-turn-helix transcriptional regulator [Solobacterium sp.]|nr:helix-turn-helix transcriptional regulator [Solobacterium sp.]